MRNFKFSRLTIVATLSVALCACAGQSGKKFETPHNSYQLSNIKTLTNRQRADLYEAIIAADMAEHQQDRLTAMSYYLYAAELSGNQQLIDKSIENAKAANDSLGLEQAAQTWLSYAPQNKNAWSLLLDAQLEGENISKALKTAAKLLKQETSSEARLELLESHILNREPRLAISLIRELSHQFPEEPALLVAQAKFIVKVAGSSQQPQKVLNKALLMTEKALNQNPMFAAAIRTKAHILFQLRKDAQARSYLKSLYIENPESIEISQMLGQLLYDLQDYDAAISHYSQWLKTHPDDLEAQNYLAASYYAQGQYFLSLKYFEQLLSENYQVATSAFYCGDSAQKSGKIKLAMKCFESVEEGRFLGLAKIQLANLLITQKKYQQALDILQGSYDVDEKAQTQLINAEITLLDKHFSAEQAKQRLEEALQQTPDNFALLIKKIELYKLLDKPDQLHKILLQARQLIDPGDKLDNFDLAVAALLRNNRHYQLSIDWLNQALESKPDDKELLYTRALYKEPLGLYQEMLTELKYLLKLYPDDLNIKNALGYTLADANQELSYAQALIDSAYQGLPDNPAVIDSKGWVAYRHGQLDTAYEYLTRAFRLTPTAEGAAHLGEVLWKQGDQKAAKAVWQAGLKLDNQNKVLLDTLERFNVEQE